MKLPKIATRELIGAEVEVVAATHSGYVGIRGTLRDETRNVFFIGGKMVPKKCATFKFTFADDETVVVEGAKLLHRPEDRLKKMVRL
jgi:ribonuclease P protein subunit POP4